MFYSPIGIRLKAGLLFFLIIQLTFAVNISPARGANAAPSVEIVMVGDVMMHTKVLKSGLSSNGTYNYDHLFSNVKAELSGADIAIVNQESVLGGEELKYTGYPSFNSPKELGDAEANAGFNVVLHGTNHALDRLSKGIENTLDFWREKHPEVKVLGIHGSEEDQKKICILNVKGIKIAILNYTYGTNGIQMPKGKGYLVDYLIRSRVREDLRKAREKADFVIVCPHWGREYRLKVHDEQLSWAKDMADWGADLIIGTHPHVIGPIETVAAKDGRSVPVYYSLGNFVNATGGQGRGIGNRMVGLMAKISLYRDKKGKIVIGKTGAEPLVCHLSEDSVTTYLLRDYTEELGEKNLIRRQDAGFSLKYCEELVDKVLRTTQ